MATAVELERDANPEVKISLFLQRTLTNPHVSTVFSAFHRQDTASLLHGKLIHSSRVNSTHYPLSLAVTHILPFTMKATPPNIFFSSTLETPDNDSLTLSVNLSLIITEPPLVTPVLRNQTVLYLKHSLVWSLTIPTACIKA